MSFSGVMIGLEFTEVLQFLAFNRKTGRLTVAQRRANGVIDLRLGKIVRAAVDPAHETLGSILLSLGLISKQTLNEAEALMRQESGNRARLGEILVAMGAVSADDVERSIRLQIARAMDELVTWKSGALRFEARGPSASSEVEADALDLQLMEGLNTEQLVLEGLVKEERQVGAGAVDLGLAMERELISSAVAALEQVPGAQELRTGRR